MLFINNKPTYFLFIYLKKNIERYRLAQVFLLAAKLDAFFHLIFSVFFIVVMSQEKIYTHGGGYMFWYIFHIFLTVSQLPSFIMARKGVIHEKVWLMNSILVLQSLYSIDFIIILQQTATSWSYWVVAGNFLFLFKKRFAHAYLELIICLLLFYFFSASCSCPKYYNYCFNCIC